MDDVKLEQRERTVRKNGKRSDSAEAGDAPDSGPSWSERVKAMEAEGQVEALGQSEKKSRFEFVEADLPATSAAEVEVERLREEARRLAHADARNGVPAPDADGPTESEVELRNRCVAFLQRWHSHERRKLSEEIGEREQQIAGTLAKVEMGIDRFHRVINEIIRLKVRFGIRKKEVTEELDSEGRERSRGISTYVYVAALFFLGLVEFFANAPVFSSLLPRDPLTDTQIQLLTETATGWFAGLERVGAHIIFRPDAALLAAGVITFLCVLGHFFGHSLRDLVMQGHRKERRHTVHARSVKENVVPIVLSAVGLVLTLGVLYVARFQLGQVGQERYTNDMAQVEELRRDAGWLRVDGDILQANQLTNQADDMEAAAVALREYSTSMSRMNFPIMLLNITLVLCAISAAYFHQRDAIREQFNEAPFEEERAILVERAEGTAKETSEYLSEVVKDLRGLKTLVLRRAADEWRLMVHQLDSVLATYRSENGRARQMDTQDIVAFANPMRLDVPSMEEDSPTLRDPEDYESERAELAKRFRGLREQFNEEVMGSW